MMIIIKGKSKPKQVFLGPDFQKGRVNCDLAM